MKSDGKLPVVLSGHPLPFGFCSQLPGFPSSLPCVLILASLSLCLSSFLASDPWPFSSQSNTKPLLTPSLSAAGRDLKLENLLLDKRENVKISDFGFADGALLTQSEGIALLTAK